MANRIRMARLAAGITQEALASRVGTSVAQISRLERGERTLTRDWATRLVAVLGGTWKDLMDDPPSPGLAEAAEPAGFAPPPAPPVDMDEVRATIQEAVAAALTEHRLPITQADIYHAAKAVERDMAKLGELQHFPATLDLRVSEIVSKLQSKWQIAKASL